MDALKTAGFETGVNYAIQKLTENLKAILIDNGADIIGFGNMAGVENCNYRTGISVAVR